MKNTISNVRTVLRVELITDSLRGLYDTEKGLYNCALYENNSRHPVPTQDSLLCNNFYSLMDRNLWYYFERTNEFYFGFVDENQFRSWLFDDAYLMYLHDQGYHLAEYKISDCYFVAGNAQCIFVLDKAVKVGTKSLLSFVN